MSKFIELTKALVPSFKSQRALDNAYLAEAINPYDFERRMQDIDVQSRNAAQWLSFRLSVR